MADNEVPIKITGDATGVKDAADAAKEHLDRVSKSVEMLGDLIGVKVPDGISKMLASSELIGPALDAAFAPLAVIALGVAIFDLTEKLKQERAELEKTKAETLNEALAVNQYAAALQTNNLKLQDQLAILQKKPPMNGVKIAMEEGRKATADLVDEFTKAIDKLDELLQKQKQGVWDRLMNGDNGSNDVIEKAHEFKTAIDDLSQQMNTAAALDHEKEAAGYKTSLDKKQAEFRRYIAEQQKALADKKAGAIDTLTKNEVSVASGPNGETQVRDALSLADATKQVNEQYRDEQRLLNDLTIYTQSQGAAAAQVAKNNALSNQIAVAEAQKSKTAFEKAQNDKVNTASTTTTAIIAIDEKGNQKTMAADFAAIKAENDAVIKAANQQLQTWDEGYKGQIEVAKIASETKIQLITQDFEKGKIIQQQEIALIAKRSRMSLLWKSFTSGSVKRSGIRTRKRSRKSKTRSTKSRRRASWLRPKHRLTVCGCSKKISPNFSPGPRAPWINPSADSSRELRALRNIPGCVQAVMQEHIRNGQVAQKRRQQIAGAAT